MAASSLRDELNCSFCLSIYADPVTLRCGHNFCRACIDQVLDTQESSGLYKCPDCREEYQQRPTLYRNITLRNIAEKYRSAKPKLEDTEIFSDGKSVMSEEPRLADPITFLVDRNCSIHNKLLKYYCPDDNTLICITCCLTGKHSGHQVLEVNEAYEKKKKRLGNVLESLTLEKAKTKLRVQSLQEHIRAVVAKAASQRGTVTSMFNSIRRQLEELEGKVLAEISRQENQVSLSVSDMIQELDTKMDELSKRMSRIEELCTMADPETVLQEPDGLTDGDDEGREGDVGGKLDDLDEVSISETIQTGLNDIISSGRKVGDNKGASDLIMDVKTAANNLDISEDRKCVSLSHTIHKRPETPERFLNYQVLSAGSVSSGQHSWEIETSRHGGWRIGVCYASIEREGSPFAIGDNDKSWCLKSFYKELTAKHRCKELVLNHNISCKKFRIVLDYDAGKLSFYQCNPVSHLYTFTATFTEPLHVAFYVWGSKAWVRICK